MRMKYALRLLALTVVALGLFTGTASAQFSDAQDRVFKVDKLFDDPFAATHSDFAFWGKYAALGWYTGTTGGVRIYDISNPASPNEIRDFPCNGNQNDPILWDRNGNDVPDLMLLAVDRTMDGPDCDDPVSMTPNPAFPGPNQPEFLRFDANPTGWEGVRVFEVSDGSLRFPGAPFENIEQVDAQYTDCGAHTITANTKFAKDRRDPRLIVYVSSYPLRPGPTCGQNLQGLPVGQEPYKNVSNPFEEADDIGPEDPLHRVIQVLEVPLDDPAETNEIAEPEISYPGDPDEKIDWCERSVTGGAASTCPSRDIEPAAVACHDIVVHVPDQIAGGACAEQGQVWEIDEDGIPMTDDPMTIGDDEVSSGGTGQIPGAVDFFHSVMFDNGMETINWVDESFGSGCPTMTEWRERAWHPAATHQTGYMYFTDMEGNYQSRFHVGDRRPDNTEGEYCSSHMGMTVTGIKKDLLVNAWYTGGMDVIDFTDPTRLKEVAYYDMERLTGSWSAYPYTGPLFKTGPGVPVYVSDGVEDNANARGMEVYRPKIQKPGRSKLLDHLNPQTMEE
jgi:hypothetical protein